MKKTLQEIVERPLMTAYECIKTLKWETEFPVDHPSGGTGKITCSCGAMVKTGGWIGTEHAWCPECHKGMQDMTGILPNTSGSAQHIDYDNTIIPDDGRIWIPENVWGL